jgi:hypothetical protein
MREVVGMTISAVSPASLVSLPLALHQAAPCFAAAAIGTLTFTPGERALVRAPACARRARTIDVDVAERLRSFALVRWPHVQRRHIVVSESISLDPRVRPHTVTLLCTEHDDVACLHIDNASERITAAEVRSARLTVLKALSDPFAI